MKIDPSFIQRVRAAETNRDLHGLVQSAIELEHATIPPYLSGYFTLKLGTNAAVADVIRSVVIEEMLHLTIASNLLIALGGSPKINGAEFVPTYPGGLPFGIGNQPGDPFEVRLRKCSRDQVEHTFMKIEEPDEILPIPTEEDGRVSALAAMDEPKFETIGDFYRFLDRKIHDLDARGKITWHTEGQVVPDTWFPGEVHVIDTAKAASAGIALIVDQGEGSTDDPFDAEGNASHFYRFKEIIEGRALIRDPEGKPVYGGDPVVLDPSGVWNMDDDPAISKYKPGTASHRMATQFAYSYTRALNAVHNAFNGGGTAKLDEAMGVMYELRLLAQQVLAVPAEFADGRANAAGVSTGLCFERREVNA